MHGWWLLPHDSVFLGLVCEREEKSNCPSVRLHENSKTIHLIFMEMVVQIYMVFGKNPMDFGLIPSNGTGETVK